MTLLRHEYDALTEDISSVALSCADSITNDLRTMAERGGGYGRLFRLHGTSPDVPVVRYAEIPW